MSKLRVGLLFGGRSVEHEVSLASATSIFNALDPARYDVTLIGVDRDGHWRLGPPELPPDAGVDGEIVNLPVAEGERGLVSAETGVPADTGNVGCMRSDALKTPGLGKACKGHLILLSVG